MTEQDLTALINANNAPFAKELGIEVISAYKDKIVATMEVTPERCTIPPTLHGGAIMAFADNLGGVGAFINMPEGWVTSTIESKTNFLRPVPVGQKVTGETTPVKLGKTIQVWETSIKREDGELAAIVTQTQILLPPDSAAK